MRDATARNVKDKLQETIWTAPRMALSHNNRDACLVHIYPSGPGMGCRYPLGAVPLVLGRDEDSDIWIDDPSVSRSHARIERGEDGYDVMDLDSTNGTYINDVPAMRSRLKDGDYLRVGNCIYRFLMGGNVEADYHEEIYRLTIIDALTQIHNKRYLLEFLDHELSRSARHHRPLALVMFDIDRFKSINDSRGHLCGDHTLRELAAAVRRNVRKEDLFARYGGEEFALVLGETTNAEAVELAEQIRALVEAHPFQFDNDPYHVTISLGVATTGGDPMLGPLDFIREADEKLYQAKQQGRNRVVA